MNILHDDEQLLALLDDIQNLNDVGVEKSRAEPSFVPETRSE